MLWGGPSVLPGRPRMTLKDPSYCANTEETGQKAVSEGYLGRHNNTSPDRKIASVNWEQC